MRLLIFAVSGITAYAVSHCDMSEKLCDMQPVLLCDLQPVLLIKPVLLCGMQPILQHVHQVCSLCLACSSCSTPRCQIFYLS